MPNALKVDWEAIKQAYIQGEPRDAIAEQFGIKVGTLDGRATRLKWSKLKRRVGEEVERQKLIALSDLSQDVRGKLGNDISTAVDNLVDLKHSKTLGGVRDRADTLNVLANVAGKVYGWDKDDAVKATVGSITLNFNTLPTPPNNSDVVDIETVQTKAIKEAKVIRK